MSGIALIERVKSDGHDLPAIVITGSGAVPMAVKAMKAGAVDFHREAGRSARSAREHPTRARSDARQSGAAQIAGRRSEKRCESDQPSTPDIGPSARRPPNKNIVADLGISQRTVDNHRAAIMKKTGSRSLRP
jgi:two-component system, chemotaxis family, CheB/CheR fusion protein